MEESALSSIPKELRETKHLVLTSDPYLGNKGFENTLECREKYKVFENDPKDPGLTDLKEISIDTGSHEPLLVS